MCGIAGIMSTLDVKIREDYVRKILQNQVHRGPEYMGMLSIDNITLGHNRLKIIDLSDSANQPMVSNCKRYFIVFNGEIFNYIELKKDLKDDYDFRTNSDTEVLLASYIKYGTECLNKLNGMFAFCIYDSKEKTLFCARDRIGEKPFVYSEHSTGFYFASELGALFSIGIFSEELDEIGIAYSYLRNFRHIPEPFTKYKQIRRLQPAHAIIVKDGKIVKHWCYWSPNPNYRRVSKEEVYETIKDAVRIRLRADTDIALLLSGGVDSSIVLGLSVENGVYPKSYTLKADDEELNRAQRIAQHFNIPLKIIDYDTDECLSIYKEMMRIYGEEVRLFPLALSGLLYKNIKQDGIKVVLTGIGGDELFYGYDGVYKQLIFSDIVRFLEILPNSLLKLLEKACSFSSSLKIIFQLASVENKYRKGLLYKMDAKARGFESLNYNFSLLLDYWAEKLNKSYYIDISNWLGLILENAHSITISADLPAMMFSIESRSPFLDHRVVELAFQIDPHRKVGLRGLNLTNKLILKRAFEKIIPKHILYGKKKGFGYGLVRSLSSEELEAYNKVYGNIVWK